MTFPFPQLPPANVTVTGSWTHSAVDASNLTTYTFLSCAIGAAAGNRKVVAVFTTVGGAGTQGVASATIGGISAAQIKTAFAGDNVTAEIWQANVPTGTTATISVTWNAGREDCGVGVFALYGAASAAADTESVTSTGATPSLTIDVPAGGFGLAVTTLQGAGGSPRTATYAGFTENFDQVIEGSATQSGASSAFAVAQTGLTVSATPSGSIDRSAMAAASWGPA